MTHNMELLTDLMQSMCTSESMGIAPYRCKHIFKFGKNIGKQCSTQPRNKSLYCYTHFSPQISLKNFKVLRLIGKGEFGKIFLVEKIGGIGNGSVFYFINLRFKRPIFSMLLLSQPIFIFKYFTTATLLLN